MATTEREKPATAATLMGRQRLIQYFFFGVFLLLLYQTVLILSPFFVAILGSAILSLTVYPLHVRVAERIRRYPTVAAGVTTAMVVLIVVVPVLLVAWVCLKESPKVYPAAKEWLENLRRLGAGALPVAIPDQLRSFWDALSSFLQFWNIDPQDILLKNLDELSANMSHIATVAIRNMVFVAFNLVVLAVTLFFFLRDGSTIIHRVVELIPMAEDHKRDILQRVQDTLFGVIRGMLVVAALQGLLTGVGFALFGVPFPILLGTLATLIAPVPIIGPAGIWLPVAVGLALAGSVWQALGLAFWCGVVVHLLDAFVRPQLIGSRAKIPFLFLFLGLLGGMRVYGFAGLLLGPLVIALVLAFINIYRQEYRWVLQQAPTPRDAPPGR